MFVADFIAYARSILTFERLLVVPSSGTCVPSWLRPSRAVVPLYATSAEETLLESMVKADCGVPDQFDSTLLLPGLSVFDVWAAFATHPLARLHVFFAASQNALSRPAKLSVVHWRHGASTRRWRGAPAMTWEPGRGGVDHRRAGRVIGQVEEVGAGLEPERSATRLRQRVQATAFV